MIEFPYVIAGVFTGLVVGATGVGGGALMTPILLLIFNVPVVTAVATDLWFASITKTAAVVVHYQKSAINFRVCYLLWLGSLPTSIFIGLYIYYGGAIARPQFLMYLIAALIALTALGLLVKPWLNRISSNSQLSGMTPKLQTILTILAGVFLGVIVPLTSIGAGALGSVLLLYLFRQIPTQQIVASDIAHAIPLAICAGLSYLLAAKVDTHLLLNLLMGSIPASIVGSVLAHRVKDRTLQLALALILLVSSIKILMK